MKQFSCDRCAYCCREFKVRLGWLDILRIRSMRYRNFFDVEDNKKYLKRNANGCIFLDYNFCGIYKNRPKVCKDYPLGRKNTLYCDGKTKRLFERSSEFWDK